MGHSLLRLVNAPWQKSRIWMEKGFHFYKMKTFPGDHIHLYETGNGDVCDNQQLEYHGLDLKSPVNQRCLLFAVRELYFFVCKIQKNLKDVWYPIHTYCRLQKSFCTPTVSHKTHVHEKRHCSGRGL